MARKDVVRLYSDGVFRRHISPREAEAGLEDQTLEAVYEMRGMVQHRIGVQVRICEHGRGTPTPGAITARESFVNALGRGFRRYGQPLAGAEKQHFAEVDLKVRWWKRIKERDPANGGPKAVMA